MYPIDFDNMTYHGLGQLKANYQRIYRHSHGTRSELFNGRDMRHSLICRLTCAYQVMFELHEKAYMAAYDEHSGFAKARQVNNVDPASDIYRDRQLAFRLAQDVLLEKLAALEPAITLVMNLRRQAIDACISWRNRPRLGDVFTPSSWQLKPWGEWTFIGSLRSFTWPKSSHHFAEDLVAASASAIQEISKQYWEMKHLVRNQGPQEESADNTVSELLEDLDFYFVVPANSCSAAVPQVPNQPPMDYIAAKTKAKILAESNPDGIEIWHVMGNHPPEKYCRIR
jgi:hypothetical protein